MNTHEERTQLAVEASKGEQKVDAQIVDPRTCQLETPLHANFEPKKYSVLIGRGKINTDAVGNLRLQVLASTILPRYMRCKTKQQKTEIVSMLVSWIQEACGVGAFVKKVDGRWWEVSGHMAREKVGYVLRDLLAHKYRSSSKAKVARRRVERQRRRSSKETSDGRKVSLA